MRLTFFGIIPVFMHVILHPKYIIMKKIILASIIITAFIFSGCKKDDTAFNNAYNSTLGVTTVQYNFTASMPGNYTFKTVTGKEIGGETVYTSTWTSKVAAPGNGTATFHVYQPADWVGTSNSANVNMQILVNGKLAASLDTTLIALDHAAGVEISANY